ncbi:MAG: hypothetical protein WCX64_00225 [Candidatus Micrarchaeia archaeon]
MNAAEAAAEEDAVRPPYTPEEEQEVRALWSEPIEEKEIDGKTVMSHFDRFVETRNSEQLKSFARLLLKHGFDLPQQRAKQLAEIVVQNDYLKGGFHGTGLRDIVADRLNAQKKGPERNVTAVVLSNPRKYSTIFFEHFFRRPPGGKPFLTPEEWEHGKMPPKRRGPTA